VIRRRWNKAQEAEKKYWRSTKETWLNENRRLYWQGILKQGFGLDYNFFLNKDVLEIGCGPSGIIFQIDTAKYRIGLEPMDLSNLIEENWKRTLVRKGIGEELPFYDDSFDTVISFNALDHSIDPERVIQEIRRVLRDNGDFLLWVYTLRKICKPLQGILNKLDPPHPNHFTFDEIISKISNNSFRIEYRKYEKGTGLKNDTIKRFVGNLMMDSAWIWSKKV
jgi:SAM-dependent methyltransferase